MTNNTPLADAKCDTLPKIIATVWKYNPKTHVYGAKNLEVIQSLPKEYAECFTEEKLGEQWQQLLGVPHEATENDTLHSWMYYTNIECFDLRKKPDMVFCDAYSVRLHKRTRQIQITSIRITQIP